jgi:phenylacetate-CoA ligase
MVKVKGVKLYPSEIRAVLLGIDGLDGAYRLTVSAKTGGGDKLSLDLKGMAGDEAAALVSQRFKSQTLISVDEIQILAELGDGPSLNDKRGK